MKIRQCIILIAVQFKSSHLKNLQIFDVYIY